MSWTSLSLMPNFTVTTGYPAARVRPLSGISNAAEMEGYLTYGGSASLDVPVVTAASLPSGTFDPSGYHTVCARWYDGTMNHVGTGELLVTEDGGLAANTIPAGGVYVFFGQVYPVS